MPSHPSSSRKRGRSKFIAAAAVLVLAGTMLFWPTSGRSVERQLISLSQVLSCSGRSMTPVRIQAMRNAIRSGFSPATDITIQGATNDSFSQEQLFQEIANICSRSTRLQIHLNQVAVDIARDQLSAQARADISVEYENQGRLDREHRLAIFSLRKVVQSYRIAAVKVSANIVNQPEPRP